MGAELLITGLSEKPPLPVGWSRVCNFAPPRNPFALPRELTDALFEFRPDVVHFHDLYNPRSATLARWLLRRGIPYAVSAHGGLMPGAFARDRVRKEFYIRLVVLPWLRNASLFHAISAAEAEALSRLVPGVPCVVAPHGIERVDLTVLDGSYLRRRCPPLEGKRILGFLGRLDPFIKGLDLLAEACSRARMSLGHVRVALAGPEWRGRTESLYQLLKQFGLSNMFHFLGPIVGRERFDFLFSCDAVVLPSRSEAGIPFSVLEALEAGRPCLVSEAANAENFFRRYRAGLQIPPTVEGVAGGLRYFAGAAAEDLRAMGEEGRRGVQQEFSWEGTADTLLRAYRQIRKTAGSGRRMSKDASKREMCGHSTAPHGKEA
jgi:glycosyltransferase involved in cell wall biosynthesis